MALALVAHFRGRIDGGGIRSSPGGTPVAPSIACTPPNVDQAQGKRLDYVSEQGYFPVRPQYQALARLQYRQDGTELDEWNEFSQATWKTNPAIIDPGIGLITDYISAQITASPPRDTPIHRNFSDRSGRQH